VAGGVVDQVMALQPREHAVAAEAAGVDEVVHRAVVGVGEEDRPGEHRCGRARDRDQGEPPGQREHTEREEDRGADQPLRLGVVDAVEAAHRGRQHVVEPAVQHVLVEREDRGAGEQRGERRRRPGRRRPGDDHRHRDAEVEGEAEPVVGRTEGQAVEEPRHDGVDRTSSSCR